jgi:HSP20 family molecular chaperone IbpA
MANDVLGSNNRPAGSNGTSGGAVAYSPLREMLGYDPFRRFFSNFDPEIDVLRTEGGFEVEIPVAGFTPSQVEIVVKDDILTITGKNERRSFTRSLRLPDEIDPSAIEAKVENGMLALKLQRHPDAQPRRIEVKSGS